MSHRKTQRNEEIIRLYVEDEMTTTQLGRKFSIHGERVRQILMDYGVAERHYGAKARAERTNAVVSSHDRIMTGTSTVKNESEIFGIKPESLTTMFRRYGLEPIRHVAQHGSKSLYQQGCRCEPCTQANRDSGRALRGKEPPHHGTVSGYQNYGCKCELCREAGREFRRQLKIKRLERAEI